MIENKNHQDTLTDVNTVISLFSRVINAITERSDHFNEIKVFINYVYNIKNWSVLRLDKTTDQLFFTILESETGDVLKQIPIKVGDGVCGRVAQTGQFEILTKIEAKHSFTKSIDKLTQFVTNSIIAVPIRYANEVVGVLELINIDHPEIFTKDSKELILLQTIADFIGVVFALSAIQQEIILSSERDSLTGLHNRHYLKQIFEDNKGPILRKNDLDEMIVVMVDLNNFKHVNDNYGHLVGDQLLKETANLLNHQFREEDLIFRYGGDEFIILIDPRNNTKETMCRVKEKLDIVSSSLPYDCSLAYGISSGPKMDFVQILKNADEKMYSDKEAKRNL